MCFYFHYEKNDTYTFKPFIYLKTNKHFICIFISAVSWFSVLGVQGMLVRSTRRGIVWAFWGGLCAVGVRRTRFLRCTRWDGFVRYTWFRSYVLLYLSPCTLCFVGFFPLHIFLRLCFAVGLVAWGALCVKRWSFALHHSHCTFWWGWGFLSLVLTYKWSLYIAYNKDDMTHFVLDKNNTDYSLCIVKE